MKRSATRRLHAACTALLFVMLPSCVQHANLIVTRPPTLGEELLSLHAAHLDGLLTAEEYELRRAQTIAVWKAIETAPVETVDTEERD